jgi:catecholate siderophore receptor
MTRAERRAIDRQQLKLAKKERRTSLFGNGRAWVAAGALAAYAMSGSSRLALAAVNVSYAADADQAVATLPLKRFDIAAGTLDIALSAYEQASGLHVRVDLPKGVIAGFQTRGVKGLYRPEEALRLLLDGTGLQGAVQQGSIQPGATVSDPTVAVVGLRRQDAVTVTAEVPNSVAMTKFTQPLLDTPQTVAAVPQFVLYDEQNTTLRDALRNVPGISMAAGEFGAQGDNLTIRGFTARNDIFLDGIRDFGSYYRDSFDYDQVEVLEGPAGVQFGRGSTGGIINQESKVPAAQPFVRVETEFGTDTTRRIEADINEPLPDLTESAALRVNLVGTEGGVAGRPYAENRHFGIAPALTFGVNGPTRETVSYFHLTENDTPDYGLPWLFNKPSPASRHAYFGFPDANYLRANVDVLTGKLDRELGGSATLHSIARWANYARDAQITEPQICSNASISVPVGGYVSALPTSSVTGAACAYTPATPASQIAVNRNELQVRSVEGDLWDQTDVTARFKVLGVRNDFDGGVEGGQEISNPVRTSYAVNGLNTVTPTNLANPTPADVFSGTGYISSITHTKSKSVGIFFVDTVHLGRLFELSGGVRWDYFDTRFNLYAPPTSVVGAAVTAAIPPISQTVHQPSYRAAFVYKPTTHGSIYFDWGTSFDPSAETLSLSVATSVLPPEENETYEAGAKYSFLGGRLMLDGAWFRTTQLNARETSPTNSTLIVEAGNQLVRGVQASAVGRLSGGLDLVVGYAYLHSAVTASQFFPTSIGYPLANVPQQTFNAFLTRSLFARFKGGFGGNYVASRNASSTVPYVPLTYGPLTTYTNASGAQAQGYQVLSTGTKRVPGYWVFNAMVSRSVSDHIELQANLYNLLNRFYIDQPHPSHLIPGAGLSALVGANFRF